MVILNSLLVDSVVAQVIGQALASLEGQVKGTVTDFVVKVCIVISNMLLPTYLLL